MKAYLNRLFHLEAPKPLFRVRHLLLGGVLLSIACQALAITIQFQAQDLTDTTVGEDLWQYTYFVSDHTFNNGEGFTVYFDYNNYIDLQDPPAAVNGDWNPAALQPDISVPDDGFYDAMAVTDSAFLLDPFTVNFVWLGIGEPGTQPFEIYDSAFQVVFSGTTVKVSNPVAVPLSTETSMLLAILLMLAGGIAQRKYLGQ